MEVGECRFSQSRGSERDGGFFFLFFRGPGSKVFSESPSLSMRTLASRMPLPPHCPCPRSIPNTTSSHSKSVGLGMRGHRRPPGGRGAGTLAESIVMGQEDCPAVSDASQHTRPISPRCSALPGPTYSLAGYASESLRHRLTSPGGVGEALFKKKTKKRYPSWANPESEIH